MTPIEIHWKIEAWKNQSLGHDQDIKDLAYLIALGVNNPKEFAKAIKKFRVPIKQVQTETQEMKRQAGILGQWIPEGEGKVLL